jgi:type II restriction/modification system DNA methylase subunit YeeA
MPTFVRLVDYNSSIEKEREFFNDYNLFKIDNQEIFYNIPGNPIAYWATKKIRNIFSKSQILKNFAESKQGLITGDNDKFLRFWTEVNYNSIGFGINKNSETKILNKKWYPYNKGGECRKWYGNNGFLVNWKNDGEEIKKFVDEKGKMRSRPQNTEDYFKEGITWTAVASSSSFGVRTQIKGTIFSNAGMAIFPNDEVRIFLTSLLNSKICLNFLSIISLTINFNAGDLGKIPVLIPESISEKILIEKLTNECMNISKNEWDSYECSWDFKTNPLINGNDQQKTIKDAVNKYCSYWSEKFYQLHENEEELNRIFIDIYDLNDELTPNIPLEDITILNDETKIKNNEIHFNKDVIIKQFISYSIGCMFGRYSPDKEGLILANQGETIEDFNKKVTNPSFTPDDDNIIPVLSDEYFKDDIVDRFKEFLRVTFGKETLAENLDFIADALERNKNETSEQTTRRYFLSQFFSDHCKMYNNRPIYWLFTSGPKKAFNALIYMHRYNKELLAKMRVDYLNELQSKLDAKKETLKTNSSDNQEKNRKQQQLIKLNKQLEELTKYHDLLKHVADQYIEIDLDDGVKVNYEKFKGLVEEI